MADKSSIFEPTPSFKIGLTPMDWGERGRVRPGLLSEKRAFLIGLATDVISNAKV